MANEMGFVFIPMIICIAICVVLIVLLYRGRDSKLETVLIYCGLFFFGSLAVVLAYIFYLVPVEY